MPIFDTPEPISATVQLHFGTARLLASDRTDTVVTVQPTDPGSKADQKAVEQTRVEYSNGSLLVKGPKAWSLLGKGGSIEVTVELPTDSQVRGDTAWGRLQTEGRLGECRMNSAHGDIQLDQTGELTANTAHGDVSVGQVHGQFKASTAHGDITAGQVHGRLTASTAHGVQRYGRVDGTAKIDIASGDCGVEEITGDLTLSSAHGDITVGRAHTNVTVRTASGRIRVGSLVRGATVLETARGDIEIGIEESTAAWLDVSSKRGRVHNHLDVTEDPRGAAETVQVRARTYTGDITIRRA